MTEPRRKNPPSGKLRRTRRKSRQPAAVRLSGPVTPTPFPGAIVSPPTEIGDCPSSFSTTSGRIIIS